MTLAPVGDIRDELAEMYANLPELKAVGPYLVERYWLVADGKYQTRVIDVDGAQLYCSYCEQMDCRHVAAVRDQKDR